MLEIYFTENEDVYGKLNGYLSGLTSSPLKILRTENGKPYLEGNPLFFSVSHSREKAVIAISDKQVGADIEVVSDRNYKAVLARFSAEERAEIAGTADFLRHWTVREAYIKMLGSTLAEKLNALKFVGGALYDGGVRVDCEIISGCKDGCVYSIIKRSV